MPRKLKEEYKNPDLSPESVGINPFTSNLTIFITKKEQKVINKFGEEDIKDFDLEATHYTKVFGVEGAQQQVGDLPIRCKELYLFLIHGLKPAQDIIRIDRKEYMKQMGIKSVNTYKKAVMGLCDGLYIQPHHNPKFVSVYWINPHYFFKGSRVRKYPDKLVVKGKL